jgi:hypothetical protein
MTHFVRTRIVRWTIPSLLLSSHFSLRKEAEGRKRYYSQEEYQRLLHAVRQRFPEHSAELIVSVHSDMHQSEQYTCAWSRVFLDKRDQTDKNQERLPPNSSTEC